MPLRVVRGFPLRAVMPPKFCKGPNSSDKHLPRQHSSFSQGSATQVVALGHAGTLSAELVSVLLLNIAALSSPISLGNRRIVASRFLHNVCE